MKLLEKDFGYWMGWIVAAIVLALSAMSLGIYLFASSALCSGAAGEHCAREWIGVLSGWFAVIAALPTVLLLIRQLRAAEGYHHDNAMIALRRKRSLATAVLSVVELHDMYIEGTQRYYVGEPSQISRQTMQADIQMLLSFIEEPAIIAYEAEVEMGKMPSSHARRAIERVKILVDAAPETVSWPAARRFCLDLVARHVQTSKMLHHLAASARDFLDATAHLDRRR